MPSKKIYILSIFCLSIIVSVWLLFRGSNIKIPKAVLAGISTKTQVEIKTNEDWKKILNEVDSTKASSVLTSQSDNYAEDNTLTSLLSKELFSKYLLLAQGGRTITDDEKNKLIEDILSSPVYSSSSGATYYMSNLKITKQNDIEVISQYNKALSKKLAEVAASEKVNPITIFSDYINTDDAGKLDELSPLILRYQSIITFLVNTVVPSEMSALHLELLNEYSNLLANTKDIRGTKEDPVRGLAGMTKYAENANALKFTLSKINLYFKNKFK